MNKEEKTRTIKIILLSILVVSIIFFGIELFKVLDENKELNIKNQELTITNQSLINENKELKTENTQNNLKLLSTQQTNDLLKRIAIDCYWAIEFILTPEETIEHFRGQDYTQEYVISCRQNVFDNWEKIWGEK